MRTLQEHIDDLDRMIDNGSAPKHEIRYQIALIGKLVAALEADYVSAVKAHAQQRDALTQSESTVAQLREEKTKADSRAWQEQARRADDVYRDE